MRTTVTLDRDVELLLREAMHRSKSGFKEALNEAVRAGLSRTAVRSPKRPFVVRARSLGLRAGLDPGALNKLADDLEVDAVLEKNQTRHRRDHSRR